MKLVDSRSLKTIALSSDSGPKSPKDRYSLIQVEPLQLEQPSQGVDRRKRVKSASYM